MKPKTVLDEFGMQHTARMTTIIQYFMKRKTNDRCLTLFPYNDF